MQNHEEQLAYCFLFGNKLVLHGVTLGTRYETAANRTLWHGPHFFFQSFQLAHADADQSLCLGLLC